MAIIQKKPFQISKLRTKLKATIADLRRRFSDKIFAIILINSLIVIFQLGYLLLRFEYLNEFIPFWYTRLWGSYQLAEKELLFVIPGISTLIMLFGVFLTIPAKRYYLKYGLTILEIVTIGTNLLLAFSLARIIFISSVPFPPLINPAFLDLIIAGLVSFMVVHFVLPRFIQYAEDKDIVTSPNIHFHPGMLLKAPSARGGGFMYGVMFLFLAVIFIGVPADFVPFYVALLFISIMGILDDFQNTHPESKLRFMENPFLRLLLLFVIVSMVSAFGAKIFSLSNPLGGVVLIGSNYVSALLTTFWIVWVLNVLSWSNGIDGQYAGIIGVASILIALLALRFEPVLIEHKRVATLAAISAGLSLGFIKFTWHPSKILWGFGAMSAGLVLSVLSIMISSKIITSVLIILIPFIDALVTVIRRMVQKKNPLKGDKGHLHHLLLQRGWGARKIAVFYWGATAFFGTIGYMTADKLTVQTGMILLGLAAFVIVLLNIGFKKETIASREDPA